MNKDKILYILLTMKTILAFILSYDLIAKGDCGRLINIIGNSVVCGNVFIGLIIFGIITIVNIILINIGARLLPNGIQKRLILKSTFLDLILLFIVFYFGINLWIGNYLMPLEDALPKISVLVTGLGFLLYFINFIIVLPYCIISVRRN